MARSQPIDAVIKPAVEGLGFELVGVAHLSQGQHSLIRIYIDTDDEQGITIDNCADVSRQVSAVLDVEDPISGEYTLEVSSPGIDRPLFSLAHFEKYAGQQVVIRLQVPLNGRRKFKGELVGVEGETVVVTVDGEQYHLPFDDIDRANIVPVWE